MASKKNFDGDSPSKGGNHQNVSSTINPPVPILNIPNPGVNSIAKSPNSTVSSSNGVSQNRNADEPEVMVLDDDEEMDPEVRFCTFTNCDQ